MGRYAYVADGPSGFLILDLTDPARPREAAALYIDRYVYDVALAGRYAYLAGAGAGLLGLDLSDPARPREAGFLDTPWFACGVAAGGETVYVADGWAGIRAMDVSNPGDPTPVSFFDTGSIEMEVQGGIAYIADERGLDLVDVRDARSPKRLGYLDFTRGDPTAVMAAATWGVAVENGLAYVAHGPDGIRIVDVSDPARPALVGSFRSPGVKKVMSVAVRGGHAFAGEYSRLYVIDVADPRNPRQVALFEGLITAERLALAGDIPLPG